MKKLLSLTILSISTLFIFQSCKKNEKADPMPNQTIEQNNSSENTIALTTAIFTKDSHDFGNLKKGEIVQHIYEITNTGNKPLIISSVNPACGCTAPEYTKEPIAPGEKGSVTLSFNSTNFSGIVTKTAQVYTNTDNSPFTLSFKANIQ